VAGNRKNSKKGSRENEWDNANHEQVKVQVLRSQSTGEKKVRKSTSPSPE
jgi:hypothetical protein